MAAFFGEFLTYVIQLVIFVAVGACGGYVGYKLRKNKTAKENGAD